MIPNIVILGLCCLLGVCLLLVSLCWLTGWRFDGLLIGANLIVGCVRCFNFVGCMVLVAV